LQALNPYFVLTMELQLRVIGVVLILLGAIHAFFPRYFAWKQELGTLSLVNRQMMYVHAFFIALAVALNGVLCLTSAEELMTTPLGKRVCLGIGAFWLVRLYFQFFVYSSELWKGKRFETGMHLLFTLLWAYVSGVFIWVWWG
jgi:hypothetical protein